MLRLEYVNLKINFRDGIAVTDASGNVIGKSQTAGYQAIGQVAISRVATAFPVVFVPGMIMSQLERTKFLRNNPRFSLPLNLGKLHV
jgi:hypothetical protein